MAQLKSGKTYIIPKTGIKDYIDENGSNHTLEEYFIWFANKIKTGLNLDLNYHIISDENIKHCFLDLPYINEPTENKLQLYLQIPSSGITSQVIPRISFVNNEDYYINKINPDCLPRIMCYGQRSAYYVNYWTTDEYNQKVYLSYVDRGAFVIDTNFLDSHGFYTIYFIVMSSSISEISEVYFTPRVFICDMIDVLEDKHSDAAFTLPNSENIPAIGVEKDGKYSLQGYYPQIFISDYPFYGEINYPVSNSMIRVQFGRLKAANNIYLTLGNTTENLIEYCDRSLVTKNHISWNENVLKIDNKKYSLSCSCLKTDFDTSSCQWAVVIEDKEENKPKSKGYLKFSSDGNFSLSVPNDPDWERMEYSLDNGKTWAKWNGKTLSGDKNKNIYIRGINNKVLTKSKELGYNSCPWNFTGKYIDGNIETLLDYKKVKKGEHPSMGNYCYSHMFYYCDSLERAPELPAMKMEVCCYQGMFYNCISLKEIPKLPATKLATRCYDDMFVNCTSLTKIDIILPAVKMESSCYHSMFYGCNSIETVSKDLLPSTELANDCYRTMFYECTSLKNVPKLPATILAEGCYRYMYFGCSSLVEINKLPAIKLTQYCYNDMYYGCKKIKISQTKTEDYQNSYRIPNSGTGISATNALLNMIYDTGGSYTGVYGTIDINTTYYTSNKVV